MIPYRRVSEEMDLSPLAIRICRNCENFEGCSRRWINFIQYSSYPTTFLSYNQVSGKNDLTMVSAIKSSSLGPKSPKSARPKRLSKLWWNNTAIVKLTASNLSKIRMLWAKTLAGFQVCECLMYLANNHLESNESFNGILHLSIPYKKKRFKHLFVLFKILTPTF